nr:GNAT family N-acetyltransferase [Salsipaludibacter albus]
METARTTIRPWRTSEADLLLDIRRRPEVARWLGSPVPWTDRDEAVGHLAQWREQATPAVPSSCAIVPRDTGVPVGTVTLMRMPTAPGAGEVPLADAGWLDDFAPLGGIDGRPGEIEVGWYLHPDAVGHGWASEAAAAMLTHGFAHGASRIWAVMWPDNAPSAAVCRRLGMAELGVRVDPWYGTADDPDSRVFLATAPETVIE